MRVLIDLQHPAELHVFKNLAALLREAGHETLFTGRDKDILADLARARNGLAYRRRSALSRISSGVTGRNIQDFDSSERGCALS